MSKKTVRKAIRLTPEMDAAVDAARGDVSWSRWVERAIEAALLRSGEVAPKAHKSRPANVVQRFCPECGSLSGHQRGCSRAGR